MNGKYNGVLSMVIPLLLLSALIGCTLNTPALFSEYDARIKGDEILTPQPPPVPRINTPELYGCTANKPLVFRIPTQGERPIKFNARNLPSSVILDEQNGILQGKTPARDGKYTITITAKNSHGKATRDITLVVGNTLALTPPMGWNHWYTHYHFVTDKTIRNAASAMVRSGMADVGYSYLSIDDCWMRIEPQYVQQAISRKRTGNVNLDTLARMGDAREGDGRILPNKEFPDMGSLTAFVHDFGLKAGIYTSPGPRTCQLFEGSWQHEELDAKTYAEWGFDLLKYDWCHYREIFNKLPESEQTVEEYIKPYQKMGDILKQQNRDMVLNLCQYGMADVWKWGRKTGHSWRTGGDLGHTIMEGGIYTIAQKTIGIGAYNGPGGWNDPDYLIMGKWRSPFNKGAGLSQIELTANEQYSSMALWCLKASPLFFSGDMDQLDDFTLNVLANNEMIAVNQDALGQCADPVRMDNKAWILKKRLSDGSLVIGVFDVANQGDQKIILNWDEIGIEGKQSVRDLWRQKEIGQCDGAFSITVGKRGCSVIRLTAS